MLVIRNLCVHSEREKQDSDLTCIKFHVKIGVEQNIRWMKEHRANKMLADQRNGRKNVYGNTIKANIVIAIGTVCHAYTQIV